MAAPKVFTSETPVFMPIEYADIPPMRLDSNVVYFEESAMMGMGGMAEAEADPEAEAMGSGRSVNYGLKLIDIFAVKGGPRIRFAALPPSSGFSVCTTYRSYILSREVYLTA